MIDRLLATARQLLQRDYAEVAPQPWPAAIDVPAPPAEPEPAADPTQPRRGRPMSEHLRRAVALLEAEPGLMPSQVAAELGVSGSYARTLLRRARERQPRTGQQLTPSSATRRAAVAAAGQTQQIAELTERLHALEQTVELLQSRRVVDQPRWDLSRRSEVIRRALAGETPSTIATELQLSRGEVSFILQIHRRLTGSA